MPKEKSRMKAEILSVVSTTGLSLYWQSFMGKDE